MSRRRLTDDGDQLVLVFETPGQKEKTIVPVVVNGDGEFWAEWEGESFRSLTFKGLREKLMPRVRRDLKRCAVPVLRLGYDNEWEEMTLIGLNAQNGNALVVNGKGRTEQHRSMGRSEFFPVLTAPQRAAFAKLVKAQKEAERAVRQWKAKHTIVPKEVICKAIGMPMPAREPDAYDGDDD